MAIVRPPSDSNVVDDSVGNRKKNSSARVCVTWKNCGSPGRGV